MERGVISSALRQQPVDEPADRLPGATPSSCWVGPVPLNFGSGLGALILTPKRDVQRGNRSLPWSGDAAVAFDSTATAVRRGARAAEGAGLENRCGGKVA